MVVKGVVGRESNHDLVDCRWNVFELQSICQLSNGECMREFFEPEKPAGLVEFTTVVIPEEFL